MPFEKGRAKTGGKVKGTKNKLSLAVASRLEELGHDPLTELHKIQRSKECTLELRAKIECELLQYLYPKRKSIEHSGPGGEPIEINVSGTELLTGRIAGIVERRREIERARQPQ